MRLLLPAALLAAAPFTAPAPSAQGTNCNGFLTSQAEVDAFDCTTASTIRIRGTDVTNLDGLSELTAVDGSVWISDNPLLDDVSGLSALETVSGFFRLEGNASLQTLDGLDALASVGGLLSLASNDALANVDALASLAVLGSNLQITSNPALTDLDGLSGLQDIGGSVVIQDNDALTDVDGLADLARVGGFNGFGLTVRFNDRLERCAAGLGPVLSADQTAPSTIQDGFGGDAQTDLFQDNGAALPGGTADSDCTDAFSILAAYEALNAQPDYCDDATLTVDTQTFAAAFDCSAVAGDLVITGSVVDLDSFSRLRSVGGALRITNAPSLTSVSGLAQLESVGGALHVVDAPLLPSLAGLEGLRTIGGQLRIAGDNDLLTEITELSGLTSLGRLYIFDTSALTRPPTLSGLTTIGRMEFVAPGPAFTSLDGLETIETSGPVVLNNTIIASLSGLSGLRQVNGSLTILRTRGITDLSGLENLRTITSYFDLRLNSALQNVDALAELESVGSLGLYFGGNVNLERCAIGIGPILAAGGASGQYIADNDPEGDCTSAAAVLAAYEALEEPLGVSAALGYGTCPEPPAQLAAGRERCQVQATGTLNAEPGRRYTVFLRLRTDGGFSRVAFRGEIQLQPGEPADRSVQFQTRGSDPAGALTLELVVEEGSVAVPGAGAEVVGSLALEKAAAGLRADVPLVAFPNPAAEATTLRFAAPDAEAATLVVYDALGREVARPLDGPVDGVTDVAVAGLASGVYVARLTVGARTETARFTILR